MIDRYTRPEMAALWSDQARYDAWLAVELAACRAMEGLGHVPAGTTARIEAQAVVKPERILAIEATVKHDVIAFLTQIEESVGEDARWLHLGLTSSDVLDTSFAWLLKQTGGLILEELDGLLAAVRVRAVEQKRAVCIGRSHGIHAEPTTIGLVFAVFHAELQRNRARLQAAVERVAAGKVSGAVGTFANVEPAVETAVCAELGLVGDPASTQVVQRDRHAEFFSVLAILGASIERFAVQVRHWQRTEVGEAEESFTKGQKGSSAMPHKRNPILSENLTGLARLLRSHAQAALENVALWHERDISHSSVERVIGPDATTTAHFMLVRCTRLVKGLVFRPENIERNLWMTGGLVFSQRLLLDLARAGVPRQTAYVWVQRNAMKAFHGEGEFEALVRSDVDIAARLDAQTIGRAFDLSWHMRHVDTIFERVFGPEGAR